MPVFTIRVATSENVPSKICAQWRFWSACAHAQADQNLHWAQRIAKDAKFLHWNNHWLRPDCADAQANMYLCCALMSHRRQFTWNAKSYFLWEIKKMIELLIAAVVISTLWVKSCWKEVKHHIIIIIIIFTAWRCVGMGNKAKPDQTLIYSQTSIARTPMARLPWLIRTRFWVPTKFFRQLKKTNI